jgi:hypothetical protein
MLKYAYVNERCLLSFFFAHKLCMPSPAFASPPLHSLVDIQAKFKEEAAMTENLVDQARSFGSEHKECKGDFVTVLLECDTLTALLKEELDQV